MRYWKRVDGSSNTTTVESYSHDLEIEGAIEITKSDYNNFITSLPPVMPEPTRDLAVEIDSLKARSADYDDLKARVGELEKK